MYQNIFNTSTDGMLIIENGIFVDCNDSVVKMLQYENKEQLLNTHPSELSPKFQPDGKSSFDKVEENAKYVLEHGSRTFEWVHLRADGTPFWVEVVLTDMSTADRVIFLTVWREIGEKKRLEEKNTYQHMILTSVLNSSVDLIFYKDYSHQDGKYIGCNHAFEEFAGKSEDEIIGHDDIELFGKELGSFFREKDLDVIRKATDMANEEWVTYPNGEKVLLHTLKSLLIDKNDHIIGIIGISRDITSEHKHKVELEKNMRESELLANTDVLTGIANRRSFFDISEKLIKISSRSKAPLSLLMIDIDYFKAVNDTYGHIVGDDILKYVANHIKSRLRDSDVFARFGGEEFIVLLPGTKLKDALDIAEEIRSTFSDTVYVENKISIPVKLSIGVSQYKDESLMREFIQRVDRALYKAKEKGRNRVESE